MLDVGLIGSKGLPFPELTQNQRALLTRAYYLAHQVGYSEEELASLKEGVLAKLKGVVQAAVPLPTQRVATYCLLRATYQRLWHPSNLSALSLLTPLSLIPIHYYYSYSCSLLTTCVLLQAAVSLSPLSLLSPAVHVLTLLTFNEDGVEFFSHHASGAACVAIAADRNGTLYTWCTEVVFYHVCHPNRVDLLELAADRHSFVVTFMSPSSAPNLRGTLRHRYNRPQQSIHHPFGLDNRAIRQWCTGGWGEVLTPRFGEGACRRTLCQRRSNTSDVRCATGRQQSTRSQDLGLALWELRGRRTVSTAAGFSHAAQSYRRTLRWLYSV